MSNKHFRRTGLLAAFGTSVAIALTGCGGAKTNGGAPGSVATPTVYGLNTATNAAGSGIEFPSTDGKSTLGGIVGALSSTATALEGAVPLGFPAGPLTADLSTNGVAVPAGQPGVVFGALIGNGNLSSTVGAITGASLASPEVSSFKETLTFTGVGTGPIGSAGYTSPAFTLPFTTSGIHQFVASVTDEGGQMSTTTLGVVVVAPTDVALVLQSFDTGTVDASKNEVINAIAPGDLVTIDGTAGTGVYPTGYAATTADPQGTVVLFTKPGTHTVVETDPTGKKVVNTSTFTLAAGAAGTTIYIVPAPKSTTPAPATRGSVRPHVVVRRH